jgi:GTP cyclohydrolase I
MQYYFIGMPGSGKTTAALHLASRLKIAHVNYRVLVLNFLKRKTKDAKTIKRLWLESKPFPPGPAFAILKEYLGSLKTNQYVLDGYPKTENEAHYLVEWLKHQEQRQRITFVLDLETEDIHERLLKRLICPNCAYISANPNINSILGNACPYCNARLIRRKDDVPAGIESRIQRYLSERGGMIKEMGKIAKLEFIDASRPLAEVINEVMEKAGVKERTSSWEAERGARLLVEGLGLDLADPNIVETPFRIAKSLKELSYGVENSAQLEIREILKTIFPTKYKGMIIMEPIKVISLCSHHLLPIEYEVLFGYIPRGLTLGFSKIIKAIGLMAAKPSLQEDFTQEVIDTFKKVLNPEGVMVVVRGRHSCMALRGEKSSNVNITSAVRGAFHTSERTRNEFLALAKF